MMFRRPTVTIALCLFWFSVACSTVHADIVDLVLELRASVGGNPVQNAIIVGDALDVGIYLTSPAGGNLDPNFSNSGSGLSAFAIHVTYDDQVFQPGAPVFEFGGSFIPPATVTSISPISNGEFTVSATKPDSPWPMGTLDQDTGNYSLLLGTVHLQANSPIANSTFIVADPAQGSDGFLVGGATGVDSGIFSQPGTVNQTYRLSVAVDPVISAVPEPGSMSLVALAGAGSMWLAHRRRRRRGSAE
ncbi:MAG: PEP-CTERM sorting domain-containing protein [Aureliella sp.]